MAQYTHNTANEYLTVGGTTVYYDAAGNLSRDRGGYQYFYDQDNRLTQVKNSGGTVKAGYDYDAIGRRIRSIIGSTTTQYYYDGHRVLLETNAGGATDQRYYVWGNYIDEALMMRDCVGSADYYYVHDHLYSVSVLFASGGTVSERYEYDAYGKAYIMSDTYVSRDASSYGNRYTFTGRELDSIDSGALKIIILLRFLTTAVSS
jgi:YD repeat-containing protein